ncbi:MAG: hypothetical protein IJZ49_08670 [Alistipes sp.]|nr:hypothetical protein [Alistipes sp.]
MRSSNFIFVLMGLLLCSCGSKEVVERVDTFFTPDEYKIVRPTVDTTKMLTLEELPIEVFGAQGIAVKDSLLFVSSTNKAARASIVSLNTNRVLVQVAPSGRGPSDFGIALTTKQFWYNDRGELIINTYDSRALKPINITKSIKEQGSYIEYSKSYSDIYSHEKYHSNKTVLPLGDDEYFILQKASYRDARECKFFPSRYIIKTKDEQYDFNLFLDVPISEDDPMLPMKILSDSRLFIKPDLTKIVDIHLLLDYINIIDLKRRKVTSVIEPNTPCYDQIGKMDLGENIKNGAFDADVTDEYILVAYDGRTMNDGWNRKPQWASLRLYDWEGNFIKAAQLPKIGVDKMAYDVNRKTAYFLNCHEEKIYRCDLSEFME